MRPSPVNHPWLRLALPLCGLLALAACKREPAELQGAATEPAAAVRDLARHLQRDDLAGFARAALPPAYHAQLETAWREGRSRWPLTELPLDDQLLPMLTALSAPDAGRKLRRSFDSQFARQDRDLREAARTLGLFGVQYVRNEGDYSEEERDHYAQVIAALSDWAAQAPLGDPARAHAAIDRLTAAARQADLASEEALQAAGMQASLQRLAPVSAALKATLASYGLDLDATLTDLRTGLVEQEGGQARVRIHYPLGEAEIDTVVSLERHDGRWYLSGYLRQAEAAMAPPPVELPPPPEIDPAAAPPAPDTA